MSEPFSIPIGCICLCGDIFPTEQAMAEHLSMVHDAFVQEDFSVQLRSEKTGIQHVNTLAEALRMTQADRSIWKVSFSLPTGERVRLVKKALGIEHGETLFGWMLEPILPSERSGSLCPIAPDTCWIDDVTGEHVNAHTGQRTPECSHHR